jgi:AcrR family transcriptional regulator
LQVNDENFIVQSFDGWEPFLRATWRLLPGLPESVVTAELVLEKVLDAAHAQRMDNYIRDTYDADEIVDMLREALNDLITLFPHLWELVYWMAGAERLNVAEASVRAADAASESGQVDHRGRLPSQQSWAEVMRATRDRLREEAGAAGAAGPSSSSAAGPSSAAAVARRRTFHERDDASETQGQRQRRRRGDQPP